MPNGKEDFAVERHGVRDQRVCRDSLYRSRQHAETFANMSPQNTDAWRTASIHVSGNPWSGIREQSRPLVCGTALRFWITDLDQKDVPSENAPEAGEYPAGGTQKAVRTSAVHSVAPAGRPQAEPLPVQHTKQRG